jgi:hypothetical protein
MPRKKKVDSAKLIKAVESGRPAKEIMAEFGFNTPTQLKTYYLDALVEKGKAAGITGKFPRASKAKKAEGIKVNKRGSLVIPRERVEGMGFKIGEAFTMRQTKAGISLKRV